MVREGSSHEGNLLSSFAHSSILTCFPAQLVPDALSTFTLASDSDTPRDMHYSPVCETLFCKWNKHLKYTFLVPKKMSYLLSI